MVTSRLMALTVTFEEEDKMEDEATVKAPSYNSFFPEPISSTDQRNGESDLERDSIFCCSLDQGIPFHSPQLLCPSIGGNILSTQPNAFTHHSSPGPAGASDAVASQ